MADRTTRLGWALTLLLCAACGMANDSNDNAGTGSPLSQTPAAGGHAVVLLYHHVAEHTPASTSVSPDTFRAHLAYLAEQNYQVLPISRVVGALRGTAPPLPPRAVAITFDDAYASVHQHAAPLLARHGYPYAVFVSTGYIGDRSGNYMTWDALRELEAGGAEIGNHSQRHGHYLHRAADESPGAWRARISEDIGNAQARLEAELAAPLRVLAYPYGEFAPELTRLAADLDFVAFGQQSGPLGPGSDLQALPRFPMAGRYANVEDLAEKLRTRPFQVTVLSPRSPILEAGAAPPTLRLRLTADAARLEELACFVGSQPPPEVRVDPSTALVQVTAQQGLPGGRTKYTCTAPARDAAGGFYWYSHLWMVRPAPGAWYRD